MDIIQQKVRLNEPQKDFPEEDICVKMKDFQGKKIKEWIRQISSNKVQLGEPQQGRPCWRCLYKDERTPEQQILRV